MIGTPLAWPQSRSVVAHSISLTPQPARSGRPRALRRQRQRARQPTLPADRLRRVPCVRCQSRIVDRSATGEDKERFASTYGLPQTGLEAAQALADDIHRRLQEMQVCVRKTHAFLRLMLSQALGHGPPQHASSSIRTLTPCPRGVREVGPRRSQRRWRALHLARADGGPVDGVQAPSRSPLKSCAGASSWTHTTVVRGCGS